MLPAKRLRKTATRMTPRRSFEATASHRNGEVIARVLMLRSGTSRRAYFDRLASIFG